MSLSRERRHGEEKVKDTTTLLLPRLDGVAKSLWGLYQRYPAIKISQIKAV